MRRFTFVLLAVAASISMFAANPPGAIAAQVDAITAGAPMLEPRSGHTATLLRDGKVLIAGGMRANQDFHRSAELYDPASGTFQLTGDMNLARVGHVAVLLASGKVLIAGGWIGPHECTDTAELYDPSTRKFAPIAKMTQRRGRPTASPLADGDFLIMGGAERDNAGGTATAEVFHAATLTFERVGAMHGARLAHSATLLRDGRVLIAGGRAEHVSAEAELYDPKARQFVATGRMLKPRYKHIAGLLPDGRVLVAGGSDDRDWTGAMSEAEIYDPQTGQFVLASPLNAPRFKLPGEAAPLPSGELLIAGGSSRVEIYNPSSSRFRLAAGQLSNAWHFMTETRLVDGAVLLTGGYPDSDQATAPTWIYRP